MSKFVVSCEGILGGEGCKEVAAVVVLHSYYVPEEHYDRELMYEETCMLPTVVHKMRLDVLHDGSGSLSSKWCLP